LNKGDDRVVCCFSPEDEVLRIEERERMRAPGGEVVDMGLDTSWRGRRGCSWGGTFGRVEDLEERESGEVVEGGGEERWLVDLPREI